MAIGLTKEHQALAESVRGFADRHVTSQVLRSAVSSAPETRPSFWAAMVEQGLLGLHVPEKHGGQGFGLVELAVALEELGRAATPGPYLPTVLASAALLASTAAARDELVPLLADGTRTGALCLVNGLSGRRGDGVLEIDGVIEPVLGAAVADVVIVPVTTDGGEVWVAADAADLTITRLSSVDVTRPVAKVEARELAVPAGRVLDGLDSKRVRDLAAVLLGAEATGVAAWSVATAAEYAKVRKQFGRPIGQFQGVKHKCAGMLVGLEQARAVVWDAARALDAGAGDAAVAAGVAAVIAPQVAVQCAQDCIQVLGGIGFTWEHDAHLYYRRVLSLRALLGKSGGWAADVARRALGGERRALEVDLPESAETLREQIRAELAALAELTEQEQVKRVGTEGWLMPHLPRPWGRSASALEQILIHQELRAATVARPELAIGTWVVPSIVQYGTQEQQQRFLPPLLRSEVMWCQLFSEPGAGSDLASLTTKAERAEGGWQLTGQKIWTSLAQWSQWAICLARTDPDAPKHDGITYFLVDMSSPGIEVRPLIEITGIPMFNEVFLDGVFVPDACVVGEVNGGWKVARNTLSNERVALSGGHPMSAGVKELLGFAAGRDLDAVAREKIGHLVSEGHAIDLLNLRAALAQISGTEPGAISSVGKLLQMRFGQLVAEFCHAELDSSAATDAGVSGEWANYLLSSRAFTIYGGTTEVQLNVIGERMLGLPRDPEPGTDLRANP